MCFQDSSKRFFVGGKSVSPSGEFVASVKGGNNQRLANVDFRGVLEHVQKAQHPVGDLVHFAFYLQPLQREGKQGWKAPHNEGPRNDGLEEPRDSECLPRRQIDMVSLP